MRQVTASGSGPGSSRPSSDRVAPVYLRVRARPAAMSTISRGQPFSASYSSFLPGTCDSSMFSAGSGHCLLQSLQYSAGHGPRGGAPSTTYRPRATHVSGLGRGPATFLAVTTFRAGPTPRGPLSTLVRSRCTSRVNRGRRRTVPLRPLRPALLDAGAHRRGGRSCRAHTRFCNPRRWIMAGVTANVADMAMIAPSLGVPDPPRHRCPLSATDRPVPSERPRPTQAPSRRRGSCLLQARRSLAVSLAPYWVSGPRPRCRLLLPCFSRGLFYLPPPSYLLLDLSFSVPSVNTPFSAAHPLFPLSLLPRYPLSLPPSNVFSSDQRSFASLYRTNCTVSPVDRCVDFLDVSWVVFGLKSLDGPVWRPFAIYVPSAQFLAAQSYDNLRSLAVLHDFCKRLSAELPSPRRRRDQLMRWRFWSSAVPPMAAASARSSGSRPDPEERQNPCPLVLRFDEFTSGSWRSATSGRARLERREIPRGAPP